MNSIFHIVLSLFLFIFILTMLAHFFYIFTLCSYEAGEVFAILGIVQEKPQTLENHLYNKALIAMNFIFLYFYYLIAQLRKKTFRIK